jgi:mRNA-degrading endonuclease YafQ of YafQ-DinJ toxin-antitoxin module
MFQVDSTKQYDKDYQTCIKRGYDTSKLCVLIRTGTHSDIF